MQLDPYLDTRGDFAVLTDGVEVARESENDKVARAIADDTQASLRQIAVSAGVNKDRVKKLASDRGWFQGHEGWTRENP